MHAPHEPDSPGLLPLASLMREAPVVADHQAAKLKLSQATERLDPEAAAALATLLAGHPFALAACLGLAEGSPFLLDLVRAEPGRLVRALGRDPFAHLGALTAGARAVAEATQDEAEVMRALRRMRAEAALTIALADIGGAFDLDQVTGALADVADTAVRAALAFLLKDAARAGKIAPEAAVPGGPSGLAVIAMGKHGARELNYSSDIDLVVVYDREQAPLAAGLEPSPFFVRITKGLVRLIQERTADGYVLRVDLRLRPDPGSTQVALSTHAALAYYEREGATWERAAYIKARAVAGDLEVGRAFLAELSPFVWRRVLDFQAIADVHAMKREIHAFRGHDVVAVEGHNVKLGRGGIREIEFFVQTQQLIAGGRDPMLRASRTLDALDALVEHRWIAPKVRDELKEAYCFLRRVEHRIQMVADAQSHELPESRQAMEGFAHFMGYADRDTFAAALVERLQTVQRHYAQLFEDAPPPAALSEALVFPAGENDRQTLASLARLGFRDPAAASAIVRGWLVGGPRALKTEAARAHLARIAPLFLEALARGGDPDGALIAADRFLAELPGPRLLAALDRHPDLVRLLATILTAAPRLGETLARRPSLTDALLDPAFFDVLPGEEELKARLDHLLDTAATDEEQFDRARRFRQEQHVLIGVRIASGTLPAARAGEAYARLAEVIIRALFQRVRARFAETHGHMAGGRAAVVAMGKLGGREMTAGSDLDLIVLYDYAGGSDALSDGARPLAGAQYFARFTQRLVSALTALTNAGKLYDVDLRLRPSGRSGPLATRLSSFETYQFEEAWTWEHMALTRARVVAAEADFGIAVGRVVHAIMARPRDRRRLAGDILDMRRAIAAEKGEDDRWNLKHAAGGQVDVEFLAQYLVLAFAAEHPEVVDTATARVLGAAGRLGLLEPEDAQVLIRACRLYQDLTQVLRLAVDAHVVPLDASPALRALLARAGEMPDFATFEAHLVDTQAKVREIFTRLLEAEAG
ncbi:bifunctional [glutamine synthetase] adenylyltransferase/[glutamine synthetase]-adenylyl-L-tyrosine phosphorylase [Xanthobacter sp. KR7-225]|uniref:bifunctional [glutamine synthetase] adenylyltransferase/[glutamine synthetase]-adenylyl-L-tyrosine phosphorylase n=1 Tax=Xanthobacter sp. KR7-225 TaxID=3156613 RepID=UPI0032B4B5FF